MGPGKPVGTRRSRIADRALTSAGTVAIPRSVAVLRSAAATRPIVVRAASQAVGGLIGGLLALAAGGVQATEDRVLAAVVVKGEGLSPDNEATSATRLGQDEIRTLHPARVQELFEQVPGMNNQGLQIGGVADSIALRGFAGGGHGGDLGAAIDGVPLNEPTSHADGYVDFNVIVPLELEGLTVHRGPVSVLYGNYARAGVVAMTSRKGGSYREVDLSIGRFGTVDLQAATGIEAPGRRINLAIQGLHTDGAREHSRWNRGTVAGRIAVDLTPDVEVAVSGRLHRGSWDATARITEEAYHRGRLRQASAEAQDDGGEKSYASLRADLGLRLGDRTKLLVFAYGVDQSFRRFSTFAPSTWPEPAGVPWPQRKEDYDRGVFGAGANLNGRHALFGSPVDWVAGLERYRDSTDSRYRANLLDRQDTPLTVSGSSRISDRRMTFDTLAWFAQAEWAWRPWLRPSLGIRQDDFGGDCSRRGPETAAGGCGAMNDYRQTSPKIGVRSTVVSWLDLRASITRGFQLPSDAAKYVEGGRVEPTTFRQREIGATARLGRQALLDLAVFRTDSSNEIYLADTATASYANLGRSRREGLELEVNHAPTPRWDIRAAGGWFRTDILQSPNGLVVGKRIPNVPDQLLTLVTTWRPLPEWSTQLAVRRVGRYPVDAQNQWTHAGFTTVRLGLAHETQNRDGKRRRYHATIDNLFDRRHATSAGVTNGAWFYAPGAPRMLTLGLQADL